MNLQQKELVAALLIGCLLGAAAGSRLQRTALHRFWEHGPDTQRVFDKFNSELHLDVNQQETVKTIIEKHHKEMMDLQRETAVKFHAIRMGMRADMAKILIPEQKEKFRMMTQRWDVSHPEPGQDSTTPPTH